MGYDIYANGEWNVGADQRDAAIKALQEAIAEHEGANPVTYKIKNDPNYPVSAIDLYFQSGHFEEAVDGSLILHFGDDSFRHEDYDRWLFEAAAPFCEGDTIFFQGDDNYQWAWEAKGGKLIEVGSETVWGDDINAPTVVQKIVEILYPDGKPLSTLTGDPVTLAATLELAVTNIETLLRDNGFGPQAGMTELDRMADV